jgi:hypothetical protein
MIASPRPSSRASPSRGRRALGDLGALLQAMRTCATARSPPPPAFIDFLRRLTAMVSSPSASFDPPLRRESRDPDSHPAGGFIAGSASPASGCDAQAQTERSTTCAGQSPTRRRTLSKVTHSPRPAIVRGCRRFSRRAQRASER